MLRLKKWHAFKNKGLNYDYVFVSGDIGHIESAELADSEENSKAEG